MGEEDSDKELRVLLFEVFMRLHTIGLTTRRLYIHEW